MKVTVYAFRNGAQAPVGTIALGPSGLVADPADSKLLQTISATPILVAGKKISPQTPREFLRAMHAQYRSPYCQVSRATKEEPHAS